MVYHVLYRVVRYVERNALRVNLVARADQWPWSSLRRGERDDPAFPILSPWPLPRPADWLEIVNCPQSEAELCHTITESWQRGTQRSGTGRPESPSGAWRNERRPAC